MKKTTYETIMQEAKDYARQYFYELIDKCSEQARANVKACFKGGKIPDENLNHWIHLAEEEISRADQLKESNYSLEFDRIMSKSNGLRRGYLKTLLLSLTDKQLNIFKKMYSSVDEIPNDKIDWATQQVARSLAKNRER